MSDQAPSETLMTASQVRAHFGGISSMTLWRWANDEAMGFPPALKLRGRNYWRRSDIAAFEARHVAREAA